MDLASVCRKNGGAEVGVAPHETDLLTLSLILHHDTRMQNIRLSVEEISASIIKSFNSLPERLRQAGARGDRAWTTQLKNDIGGLGHKNGWWICPRQYEGYHQCGWLYDLVWYSEDEQHHLHEVFLVLESEWGNQQKIQYDFEKLLQAKATLKVMIFQARQAKLDGLVDFLVAGIKAFPKHSSEETYLLIALNLDSHAFVVHKFNGLGDPME